MCRIEELIREKCPDGVEFRRIADICNIARGRVISKDYIRTNAGEYPVYSSQTESNGELGRISTYEYEGEFLTWTTDGANAGTVFHREGKFSVTNVCGLLKIIKSDVLCKYLYYALSLEAPEHVNQGMGNAKLMSNVMADIEVPVPPIEIQKEIVRILDKFTELESELQVELDARKKQYEYYHDKLLRFDASVNKIKVKDLFNRIKGTPITAGKMREIEDQAGEIRIFAGGKTVVNAKEEDIPNANIARVPAVLVQSRGIIDFVYYDKPFTFKNEMWAYTTDNIVSVKFLFYYLKNNVEYFREAASGMGSLPQISLPVTENYEIAVPSIEVQQEIVRVLDKFTELETELQKELDARKKQYIYYRDVLLSFERFDE